MNNAELRRKSRELLLPGWNRYALPGFVYLLTVVFVSEAGSFFAGNRAANAAAGGVQIIQSWILPIGISLILELLSSLLVYGIQYYFLKLVRADRSGSQRAIGSTAEEPRLEDLLYAFRAQPDRFLVLSMVLAAAHGILFLPYHIAVFPRLAAVVWCVIGGVIYVYVRLQIALASRILLTNENLAASAAISKSIRYMRTSKMRLFKMILSFVPLALLCVCSAGVGFIWLVPYMETCMAEFFEDRVRGS